MIQLLGCGIIFGLTLLVYYLLGKAVSVRYHWNLVLPEVFAVGFFLYYVLFQVLALIMIFSKQQLHVLGRTWLGILLLMLLICVSILRQERRREEPRGARICPVSSTRKLLLLMAAAILCECATAVVLQRNIGWDFAYYMGNMATSVQTDTMYLYDGNSGFLRKTIELRYALSSFYMNTAWIAQMTGIPVLFLQKYVVGVLSVLLANAVVYSFGMEVFRRDVKKTAALVTITILLTIFWNVYDTSAQFLLLRGYEAKAYCANVVLPMIVYLMYRVWRQPARQEIWAELFLVALSSVAVSMSSLLLVPAAIFLMAMAHCIVARQWDGTFLRRTFYCLLPNLCYLLVYAAYTMDRLVVEV